MKSYKVYWTNATAIDLKEIVADFTNDNPQNARGNFLKIRERCQALSMQPERGQTIPELSEIGAHTCRQILMKPYRIIFKIDRKAVYVVAVADARRDLATFLLQRLLRA